MFGEESTNHAYAHFLKAKTLMMKTDNQEYEDQLLFHIKKAIEIEER